MPDMTSYRPGTPSWVDVASRDVAITGAFYAGLFGWEVTELEGVHGYLQFTHRGRAVAGATRSLAPNEAPLWHCYFTVDDADAVAAAARAAGGSVALGPANVLDLGRLAALRDPDGAVFSIWQPAKRMGAQVTGEVGALCWCELQTPRIEDAQRFYPELFGWGERAGEFSGMAYSEWLLGGESVAGMMQMPPGLAEEVPAFWLVYFGVADCNATVALGASLGAEVLVPPFDSPAGRFAILQDPLGASFAVIALGG
jgi:predicted enzyme related to lactoylglutathione lyase